MVEGLLQFVRVLPTEPGQVAQRAVSTPLLC